MFELGVGRLPVVSGGRLIGIVTQTDITRIQALSSATLIRVIRAADSVESIAEIVKGWPDLLAQLVELGRRRDVVTRLITDISDAVTKRVLALAEAELGPAPVPYLWLACGSQGRREQTGVSDQDNYLILSDSATPDDAPYFKALAAKATRDLAACGYVLCPGEMMASTPRWRQPAAVWRRYFETWIAKPEPTSQLLASVMFDLRPIHGESALFDTVIGDVLERAAANSIFVAHIVSNAAGHAPPLGLFGGVAVAATVAEPSAFRPWTYARPFVSRFIAVDVAGAKRHAAAPETVLVTLYMSERNAPTATAPFLVDCAQNRRGDIADGVSFQEDEAVEGALWRDVGAEDPLVATVCAEGFRLPPRAPGTHIAALNAEYGAGR